MRVQRIPRSAWSESSLPHPLTAPLKKACLLSYPLNAQQKLWVFAGCTCHFLMTDSICHSSLRRAVLETVALTSIDFCKKADHVCILVRHWIDTNQKVVRFVLDLWFKSPYEPLRKLALIHMRTAKAQIWSAPLLFAEARFFSLSFFDGEASQA